MKPPFHLTGLLLVTVACDQGGGRSSGRDSPVLDAVVRDSGQVRITENPRPPTASRLGWDLGTVATVTIGELEGSEPYLLDRVRDALVLPDGRIVVVNGGSDELRVFDASGNHVVTWGGRGGGIPFRHRVSAFAWGDFVAVAQNDGYEIRAFDLDGTLRRIVRRDHEPAAPTPAHLDAYIEDQVAASPQEERAERRAELRESLRHRHVPETHPAYAAAMSDLADHLWIREYNLPGEGDARPVWTVFGPDGRVLGFMETPAGLSIFEIGEDYILGLARDDLGVEFVQMWTLERSGR